MSAKRCIGYTLKRAQCKRKVIGSDYCYHHAPIIDNKNEEVSFVPYWNEPERDVNDLDIVIFSLVLKKLTNHLDILNLCLSSKRFSEQMTSNVFITLIYSLISQNYPINDPSNLDHWLLAKQLGCPRFSLKEKQLSPLKLYGMICENISTKTEEYVSRSGKICTTIVSGMEMVLSGFYFGKKLLCSQGTGRVIGFDLSGEYIWTVLDYETGIMNHSYEVVSCWKHVSNIQEAIRSGIVLLDDNVALD